MAIAGDEMHQGIRRRNGAHALSPTSRRMAVVPRRRFRWLGRYVVAQRAAPSMIVVANRCMLMPRRFDVKSIIGSIIFKIGSIFSENGSHIRVSRKGRHALISSCATNDWQSPSSAHRLLFDKG